MKILEVFKSDNNFFILKISENNIENYFDEDTLKILNLDLTKPLSQSENNNNEVLKKLEGCNSLISLIFKDNELKLKNNDIEESPRKKIEEEIKKRNESSISLFNFIKNIFSIMIPYYIPTPAEAEIIVDNFIKKTDEAALKEKQKKGLSLK